VVLVVCSLERRYNISINTGNSTLCLIMKGNDDDDDDDDDDDGQGVYFFSSPL